MEKLNTADTSVNIDKAARSQSLITGVTLLYSGLSRIKKQPAISIAKSILGGYLIFRGLTGHCYLAQMLENKKVAQGN